MGVSAFIKEISAELVRSVNNNYEDNYDHNRFGVLEIPKPRITIKDKVIKKLNRSGFYNDFSNQNFARTLEESEFDFDPFVYLYDKLEDAASKKLLIKLVAYRLLGHTKVKLPLSQSGFWETQHLIESKEDKTDSVDINFMGIRLSKIDSSFLGFPVTMYNTALGINILFSIKQYEFHGNNIDIEVKEGDVVLDGGGCYGDTALYFAYKTGRAGKVHVFEFIPANIKLFNTNVDLNKDFKENIQLVQHPLWSESDKEVFYLDNGPGSKVSMEDFPEAGGKTTTLAIDDYVSRQQLTKVDFIKMDIEGAETFALEGAANTIRKFRPKLAIALYHSAEDFERIPKFIDSLGAGYKFYLLHATIYHEETMLFAVAD